MREGTARKTLLDRSSPLRQRTADAATTPSRSLGAGVVVRMRENADLALIRPVEASALVGGLVLGVRSGWFLMAFHTFFEIHSALGRDARSP